MSRPITWQNVNAPTSDPLQALALAQGSFKSVFSGLNDQIKQYENTSEANWKQMKDNNTQAFLDEISKYRTPEEYQAALASGALDAQRQQYGVQLDRAAARNAQDGREAVLQSRALADINFKNAQEDQATAALKEQFKVAAANGDTAAMANLQKQLEGKRGSGDLAIMGKDQERKLVLDARGDITFGQGIETHEQQKKLWPGQLIAQNDAHNLAVAQQQELRARHLDSLPGGKLERAARKAQGEREYRAYQESGMFGKGYSDDPTTNVSNLKDLVVQSHFGKKDTEGTAAVMEVLRKNPNYTYGSGENATKVGYPPAVVQKALELTKKDSSFLGMGGGYNDNFKKAFKGALDAEMASPDVWKEYTTYNNIRANYLEGTGPGPVAVSPAAIPKPTAPAQDTQPTNVVAALDRRAAQVTPPASAPAVDPQKVLADVSAKDPKATTYWVNGERYKFRSVTDADNNVTGNAWVKDPVGLGLFASGNTKARVANAYTGEDGGSSIITREEAKAALLKNSGGVTNAPAEQPKVSAPVASNLGQRPVPVLQSSTVATSYDGKQVETAPPKITSAEMKTLGEPQTVVSAYKGAIPKGQGTKVMVTMVGDGDTFNFSPSDPKQKVPGAIGNVCRFDLIDAPEKAHPSVGKRGQPYGPEAGEYLEKMILNKEVNIRITGQATRKDSDKSRNLCQVEIEGKAVDLEMVKAGFAQVYSKYLKGNERGEALNAAESRARTNQIGAFTGGQYAQPGWDFRAIQDRLRNK